jgi:hypothetical protein
MGSTQPKSLLTFRWVRQEDPILLMATTMIRMMVTSQMVERKRSSFLQFNILVIVCLSLSFMFNVVEH